jgi:hypothetical protein
MQFTLGSTVATQVFDLLDAFPPSTSEAYEHLRKRKREEGGRSWALLIYVGLWL